MWEKIKSFINQHDLSMFDATKNIDENTKTINLSRYSTTISIQTLSAIAIKVAIDRMTALNLSLKSSKIYRPRKNSGVIDIDSAIHRVINILEKLAEKDRQHKLDFEAKAKQSGLLHQFLGEDLPYSAHVHILTDGFGFEYHRISNSQTLSEVMSMLAKNKISPKLTHGDKPRPFFEIWNWDMHIGFKLHYGLDAQHVKELVDIIQKESC